MKTLPEMFTTIVRQNAQRTAIVERDVAVTYEALQKQVCSVANELQRAGIHVGDRAALLLPNGLDFVRSFFGIVCTGAIAVPLNDHYQQSELRYFLDACGVSVLVTSRDFAGLCARVCPPNESPCRVLLVEDMPVDSKEYLAADLDPDSPVMYQFSSGSTGRPKQIARTHSNLLFELDSLNKALRIKNEDRFLGAAPFSHVNGLMRSMMACVHAGASLYPLPKFERRATAELIEKHRISLFIGVPFMFSMLAASNFRKRPDFSSLRFCISASAPMPKKINQDFHRQFGTYVRQLYGSTETGTISVNLNAGIEESLESVGKPIAGVEVEVFREDGSAADPGEMGELAVKSPAMINGYEGLVEVNREVFRNGFFFTGDFGRIDEDDLLYLLGRKKFFINKGGYKINPQEIEELISSHPKVKEAVVMGKPTLFGDEKIKAYIVLKDSCTEQEIIQYCTGKIAGFKIPGIIEFRDHLPKSPTGKIRRAQLRE